MNLTDFIEGLLENNMPFVSYRLPEDDHPVTMAGGRLTTGLANADTNCFVIAPFQINEQNAIRIYKPLVEIQGWETTIDPGTIAFEKHGQYSHSKSLPLISEFSTYKAHFKAMMQAIENQLLQKVVLTRVIKYKLKANCKVSIIFRNLAIKYPNAFVYLFADGAGALWLGATPETLIITDRNQACTMSLAGTQALNNRKPETLQWGEKELAEQGFVTNYILQKLKNAAVKDMKVDTPKTVKAGDIAHLRTSFRFKLTSGAKPLELARALHPTPAICGLPAEAAFETILKVENHERQLYCGFLGPVRDNAHTRLFVNLRCMQIIGGYAYIYVGGGLTSNSILEKEWEETQLKAETLLSVIRE